MRISEIITEAEERVDPSRRGFLGKLGKGAAAAAIAGSGLGGLMGGAKDARANEILDEWVGSISQNLGFISMANKMGAIPPQKAEVIDFVKREFQKRGYKINMEMANVGMRQAEAIINQRGGGIGQTNQMVDQMTNQIYAVFREANKPPEQRAKEREQKAQQDGERRRQEQERGERWKQERAEQAQRDRENIERNKIERINMVFDFPLRLLAQIVYFSKSVGEPTEKAKEDIAKLNMIVKSSGHNIDLTNRFIEFYNQFASQPPTGMRREDIIKRIQDLRLRYQDALNSSLNQIDNLR